MIYLKNNVYTIFSGCKMVNYCSDYLAEELIERWDEYTSPARFAGSDDMMDLIFVSKRNGDRVRLVQRSRTSRDPFACVFRGRIKENRQGSQISGVFTKAIVDYAVVAAVWALLFYIRSYIIERGDSLSTINVLLGCALVIGVALLYNTRRARLRYSEFISRIVGKENTLFLPKSNEEKGN